MNRVTWMVIGFFLLSGVLGAQEVKFLNDKVMDFGKVLQGEVIKGELKFTNVGDGAVEIERVETSCGCTAVTPTKMTYNSGETAVIPFTVKTANFSGVIRKKITVVFKNVTPKSHSFVVQANVVTELTVSPRFISFQKISLNPDTTYTEYIEVDNLAHKKYSVTHIYPEKPLVKITPQSAEIPAGKSHLFRLEFTPEKPGRHSTRVVIETDHPTQSRMTIPVFIFVTAPEKQKAEALH